MSTGADNKTMAVTQEYEDGYERIFGKREPVRGAWVQDPKTGEMVPADEYVPAIPAPYSVGDGVASGRFYENTKSPVDGSDIGSKRRHREHMKRHGLTTADDYNKPGGFWDREKQKRDAINESAKTGKPTGMGRRERRESIERRIYELEKSSSKRR
jgi:hypothetical protein